MVTMLRYLRSRPGRAQMEPNADSSAIRVISAPNAAEFSAASNFSTCFSPSMERTTSRPSSFLVAMSCHRSCKNGSTGHVTFAYRQYQITRRVGVAHYPHLVVLAHEGVHDLT